MSVKVHIVDGTGYDCSEVEKKINKFCKGKRILDIKYQTSFYRGLSDSYHNAMIIYEEYKKPMKKDCSTCEYFDLDAQDEPCISCRGYSLWEGRK